MIVKTGPSQYINLRNCCNFSLRYDTCTFTRFCVCLNVVYDAEDMNDVVYIIGGESVSREWFDFVKEKFDQALENGRTYFNAFKYLDEDLTDEDAYELVTGEKITEKELAELNDDSSKVRVKLRLVKEEKDDKR